MALYYLIILILFFLGLTIYLSYIKPRQDPLNKAKELSKQNKFLEAITEFKRALYTDPDAFDIHFKISELYINLENYDQAIFHLNETLRIDKYNLEVKKLDVLRRLAQAYHLINDIEKAFQTYFDILKINPEEAEAYYHISFITLGQEEFDIAQKYFEKLINLQDDFESFFGAGICSYQNKKNEDAANYFKEALSIRPNSDIAALAISFALQRNGKYNEAISYLGKLAVRVMEDDVKYIAKRLLSFLNLQAGRNEEGMHLFEDLLNFTKEKNMQDEVKLALYDIGFACVKTHLLDQAYKYWDQLYQTDNNYEDIKEILNLVKKEIYGASGSDGFESSIYDRIEDWMDNAFSPNLLWHICGLKSDKIIDVRNIVVPAKIAKGKDAGRQGTDTPAAPGERIQKFCDLDNETFRIISNRLVLKLGNKVDEILHTYRESDGVDLLSQSQDNNEKVLVWVRRWKGSNVGEITLRNFAQAINDIRAQKGILITAAELTHAAQKSLAKLNKIKVIYPGELNELLKGFI